MSNPLINQYYNEVDRAIRYSRSKNEDTIKSYFWNLANAYARKKNFEIVREHFCMGTRGSKVKPDGILKNMWGLDIGYWESKDEKDSIFDEVDIKKKKGYPFTNILFEDSRTAILFQNGLQTLQVNMRDPEQLDAILDRFIEYKNEVIHRFEEALQKFTFDIPVIIETLRRRIEESGENNPRFVAARDTFLTLCRKEINPEITVADVREMMIQHILTSDIFNKIFDEQQFARHNAVAAQLETLVGDLFTYGEQRNLLASIEHYYDAINSAAASIDDHHEKQKFLKVVYENFYKVYNPKAADRLGVVYTPGEVVNFMIRSADHLLHKHFGKTLSDPGVEILDPATGTGTFICDLIEYIPAQYLAHKYKHEIHANEVAILPYYIANLNIEYTFKQKMGYYEEFRNICFVDTLDNTGGLTYDGQQHDLFGTASENSQRIHDQNAKKISVIIGNPPYNARQPNYNFQNSNKAYKTVDKRIKETYIKNGTAQNQIVVYDMYIKFLRWASDRIDSEGIIAFITNNSFINGRAFDGFRKSIRDEFDVAYFIDLGGNIRELSGKDGIWLNENNTIFGVSAAVGISICFLIKKKSPEKRACAIKYIHPCDIRATRDEKLDFLKSNNFEQITFTQIVPDAKNTWINQSDTDFDDLLPLIDKEVKAGKSENALFKLFSLGVASHRDSWVYDVSSESLVNKIKFLISIYENTRKDIVFADKDMIAWDRELTKYCIRGIMKEFEDEKIVTALYRPYVKSFFYFDRHFNGMLYQFESIINIDNKNRIISVNREGSSRPFHCLVSDAIIDLHTTGDSQCLPLYTFDSAGNRHENITDWGLDQFRTNYANAGITKENIFSYVYAIFHNPKYHQKYALNLKRDFPRIPFYADFHRWAEWGRRLMELHLNYETTEPWDLTVTTAETKAAHRREVSQLLTVAEEPEEPAGYQAKVKVKLKANKEGGFIELDELTTVSGIPPEAWEYKLGNRSALEWILDQHKEKKPGDPVIAEKFNTYRFADYKDKVIDLLKRVCRVSVETVKIMKEMGEIEN